MSDAISLDCRDLGSELFEIVQGFDPARWREEKLAVARARLEAVSERTRELLARYESARGDKGADLHAALEQLRANIEAVLDDVRQAHVRRPDWAGMRKRLTVSYDNFSRTLRARSLRLPRNRPTNYFRNLYHVGSAVMIIALVQHVLTPGWMMLVALIFALFGWSLEITRRLSPSMNQLIVKPWKPFIHPDEHWRINSATWLCTGLLILALSYSPTACAIAIAVLGTADPMAAIIGRRFGRHRLHGSRTLEGSLAFVATGILATAGILALYGPEMSLAAMLVVGVFAAVPAAVVEVWSGRLDDNLTIPVFAGLGATVAFALVG